MARPRPALTTGRRHDLVRNITYFDGNAVGRALLVLAAYSPAGSLVVLALARGAGATSRLEAEVSAGTVLAA